MINEIKYPAQTTYFICYNLDKIDIMAYGSVETNQWMGTGQPILDTYLNESEWLSVLSERGIDPYFEESEENNTVIDITDSNQHLY